VTTRDPPASGWWLPILLSGSAVLTVAAVAVAFQRMPPPRPVSPAPVDRLLVWPTPPSESIPAEALVFRTRPGATAITFEGRREREAHPRTLKTFRYIRAYPGAPPSIPHELTAEEFRTGTCGTCHEQGGYSKRFTAYVPVTPHPGAAPCLQCHVGGDNVMAVSAVSPNPNRRCGVCHGVGGRPEPDFQAMLERRIEAWPRLAAKIPDRLPPPIPHDLQSRGNCLTCHAGPAAVAEIRTSHPERADCRQCHIAPDAEAGMFARAVSAAHEATGGTP
jgi:cytochrome c-type protein NapB